MQIFRKGEAKMRNQRNKCIQSMANAKNVCKSSTFFTRTQYTRKRSLSLSLSSLRSNHAWVHENANSFELISKIHCKPSHPRDSKERKFPANANECHVTYPVLVLNRIYLRCCFFFNSKLLILLIYKNNNINTCQHQNTHIGIHTRTRTHLRRTFQNINVKLTDV